MNFRKHLSYNPDHAIKHPLLLLFAISLLLIHLYIKHFSEHGEPVIYNPYQSLNIISFISLGSSLLIFTTLFYFIIKNELNITKHIIIAKYFMLVIIVSFSYSFIKNTYSFLEDIYHISSGSYKIVSGKAITQNIIKGVELTFEHVNFNMNWMNMYPGYSISQIKALREENILQIKYYNDNRVVEIMKNDNNTFKWDAKQHAPFN